MAVGQLVLTRITHPPTRSPNGHELGPSAVLVGHQACLGHGAGHTTWTCRTCDQTVYGPPLNTHCNTLNGAGDGANLKRRVVALATCGPSSRLGGGPTAACFYRGGTTASLPAWTPDK
jgi:hypothetical protein